jgi:hypothetical protein
MGATLGCLSILSWTPVQLSLELGQLDAWIALALSLSLWSVHTRRWRSAGIGMAVAALLKVTPALLIVYCLVKGQWRTAAWSIATGAAVIAVSLFAGARHEWMTFVFSVLPTLSMASRSLQNQSLTAWLARLWAPDFDLVADIGLGQQRFLSLAIALGGIALLRRLTRGRPVDAADLGLMVVVALLAGPLSWDHYTSWAILPVIHLAHRYRWTRRSWLECALLAGLAILAASLFIQPTIYYSSAAIRANWWLRAATGTKTVALTLVLIAGLRLLVTRGDDVSSLGTPHR